MSLKTIEVIINPKGEASIQTTGFTGTSCRDATKALEQALGISQSDKPTAEMYQAATTDQRIEQHGG